MGRSSAEIQYDLERQRNAVEARIQRLNRRVRDDADSAKHELKDDLHRTLGPESTAAEHPKSLVAGAAGMGMVLGMLSSSVSLRPRSPGRNGSKQDDRAYGPSPDERSGAGQSRKDRLVGAATGTVAGAFSSRLDEFVADVWDSFKSGFKDPDAREKDTMDDKYDSGLGEATERELAHKKERGEDDEGKTTYLSREEIAPYTSNDSKLDGDPEEARKILHDAEVEDFDPREDLAAYPGALGAGVRRPPSPDVGPPDLGAERSERRTGQ